MTIKIASRSSNLAIAQVEEFIKTFSIKEFELINIRTQGDIMSAKGEILFDKAHFVSDIEDSLLNGSVDVAIHSAKDMPAKKTIGLKHLYFTKENKRFVSDLLIFNNDQGPFFKSNMKLGTSSLRRRLQAKFHLNAKNISSLNGNIDTRIKKLDDGEYDCIILAEAGLKRLEHLLEGKNFARLNHISCSGQGALAVQWKENNKFGDIIMSSDIASLSAELNTNIEMEKSLLKKLKTNCNSAISIESARGQIKGEIYGIDKFITFKGSKIETLYKEIIDMGGLELLNDHN